MSGTKAGGIKAAIKVREKYGNDHWSRIGRLGGQKTGIEKGFALMNPEKRRAAGAKGGRISRRRSIQAIV